jgi:hypothetical protein
MPNGPSSEWCGLAFGFWKIPFKSFGTLRLEAKDYRPEPLKVRRKALEKLLKNQKLILPARRSSPNGFAAWTEVVTADGKGGGEGAGVTLRGRAVPQVDQSEGAEVSRGGTGLLQALATCDAAR